MPLSGALIVFVMVWWIILFMLLPVGLRDEETPIPGQAASAPKNPNIGKKMLATTAIAILVTLLLYGIFSIPQVDAWFNLRGDHFKDAPYTQFEVTPY